MSIATLYRLGGDIQAINEDYANEYKRIPGINKGAPTPILSLESIAALIGANGPNDINFCESRDGQRLAYGRQSYQLPVNETASQFFQPFPLRGDVLKVAYENTLYSAS